MTFKLVRFYKIEIQNEAFLSPIVSGFISELELPEEDFVRMEHPDVKDNLYKGQLEDILIIKETLKDFFNDADPLIVDVNEKEYLRLFASQTATDFPAHMRKEPILCMQEKLM